MHENLEFKIFYLYFTGRVAHTHLALSDHLSEGACDDLAVELSKSQSQAVDFPKTGIVPFVPVNAMVW